MKQFRAGLVKAGLHLLVERDIGAAEAVDRLLRITDQKQFAWNGMRAPPVRSGRIVRCQQKQDFRLQWVGVLKLVDEEMGVAPLQVVSHGGVITDQIASPDEEIEKIE